MKKENKKKGLQIIAILLVFSMMVGVIGCPPLFAQAKVTTDMFMGEDDDNWAYTAPVQNSPSITQGISGVDVVYSDGVENSAIAEHTVSTIGTYDVVNKGVHLEVDNIKGRTANSDEYSFIVFMGENTNAWYSSQNYADDNIAMAFSSNGYYKIWHTDYSDTAINPEAGWNAESILAIGQFCEQMKTDSLTLDIKVQDGTYYIVANGKEIRFALDESKGLSATQLQTARFGFHIWGPIDPVSYSCAYNGKGPWSAGGELYGVSYTITDLTEMYQATSITEVVLNQSSIDVIPGRTEKLEAVTYPTLATKQTITWESSNEDIAIVSEDGHVVAIGEGKATITAIVNGVSAECQVSVAYPKASVDMFMGEDDDNWAYTAPVQNSPSYVEGTDGVDVQYSGDVINDSIQTHTISTSKHYDVLNNGVHLEVSNLKGHTQHPDEYSFMIFMGENTNAWYSSQNYADDNIAMAFSSNGYYKIWHTDYSGDAINPQVGWNEESILAKGQFSESLTEDCLSIDIKVQEGMYYVRVNGKEITFVFDESKGLTTQQLMTARLGFHVWGPVDPSNYSCAYDGKGPWDVGGELYGASYTIRSLMEGLGYIPVEGIAVEHERLDMTIGETATLSYALKPVTATGGVSWLSSNENVVTVDDAGNIAAKQVGTATITVQSNVRKDVFSRCKISVFGERIQGVPDSFKVLDSSTTNWFYQVMDTQYKFIFGENGQGWERVFSASTYRPSTEQMELKLDNIVSTTRSEEYSIVIAFGNDSQQWYGKTGYMLLYGKDSGNLAIVATVDNDNALMGNQVVVWDEREPLEDTLSFQVKLVGETYEIIVNDKVYKVPAKHETYPLSNPDKVYLSFGVMSDFTFSGDDSSKSISGLDYYSDLDIGEISFHMDMGTLMSDVTKAESLKPLAKYMAFMTGNEDGKFEPKTSLTRGEAISIMAGLLVEQADIEDVYTSDFMDVTKEEKYYDSIAFMERSGFLPDFGTELKSNQAITRGEFVDLILNSEDTAEGIPMTDVTSNNVLYGKICYAIETGMLELNANRQFEENKPVTRSEAAKAFCVYLGKTTPIEEPKITFSDVHADTECADYIVLATNELGVYEVTYQADSENTIQECIDNALEISKVKDARVTIELEEDVYRLTKPITIDGSKYGAHELVIVIKNGEDKSPMITGNVDLDITEFKKVESTEYYSYQLPTSSIVDGNWPEFRDLYLNGARLQLARSQEYVFKQNIKNPVYQGDTLTGGDNGFYVDSEILGSVTDISTLELCFNVEWMNKRWRVSSINSADATTGLTEISVQDEEYRDYVDSDGNKRDFTGQTYWLENHLAFLDEPGEFYYDNVNGVIYFYPYTNTDMKNSVLSYPILEKLVDIKGASGIIFEGLTFTGTTSNFVTEHGFSGALGGVHAGTALTHENVHAGAIYGNYSSYISIRNCAFDELGSNGVFLNGGNNNIVMKGNSFTSLAMCAIALGKNFQDWSSEQGQSNIIVDNNYIYNIGTDYFSSPAIHIARVKNIAITHNTMVHTPYSGLMLGWINEPSENINVYNAEIAYNYCEDNLYALNDGAPLYFGGANATTDNTLLVNRIHDNYLKSTGYTGTNIGIYLDMKSSNYDVYRNVMDGIVSKHGPIYNQYLVVTDSANGADSVECSYNNAVRNNYTTMSPITMDDELESKGVVLENNHKVASYDKLPEEALEIVHAAGQKEAYAMNIPVKDTMVEMRVENPHITLAPNEKSEDASVVFTITNNSETTNSYSIERANEGNVQIISSTETLELAPGATGKIMVRFCSDTWNPDGERIDINVVQDNGWKMKYKRVIDVTVGFDYSAKKIDKTAPACETTEEGLKVTYGSNTNQGSSVGLLRPYSLQGDGVDIELTNIDSTNPSNSNSKDTDYTIVVMLGQGPNAWWNSKGYLIVYGKTGNLSILATENGTSSPDDATVVMSDTRDELEDTLSFNVKWEENMYLITVNGKTYEVSSEYLENNNQLYLSFGAMGDKSGSNKTYLKNFGSTPWIGKKTGKVMFTIAEISDRRAGNLVFDYTDSFSTYRTTNQGASMQAPTAKEGYIFAGWYYDTDCTKKVDSETTTVDTGKFIYAKFVDKDILSMRFQSKWTLPSSTNKINLRLITSVEGLDYADAGFYVTSGNATKKYTRTKAYASLTGAGVTYKPTVFSACSSWFITLELSGVTVEDGTKKADREITVQPYWTTLDGTEVKGWARTITVQEAANSLSY